MEQKNKHIIVIAGEASGDMHAAHLIKAIKSLNPHVTFSGLGGRQMRDCGVEIYQDLTSLAVVGFAEVLKHLGEIRRAFRLVLTKVAETKAQAIILVDYSGFNLRLAKELKKNNIKVIYYISPQVWASREGRIETIRRYVDKMIVLFPFEFDFYAKHGIEVEFVGHPLLDLIKVEHSRSSLLDSLGLSNDKLTIGLLPGSREKEIERHLPVMIQAAKKISKKFKKVQFLVMQASTVEREKLEQYTAGTNHSVRISNQTYDAINASDVCIVASGTATLETAILQKPMVVIYKTSFLTWLLARMIIRVKHIAMVNIVAQKTVAPELIQFAATPARISQEVENIIKDEIRIADIKSTLAKIKTSLGQPGACRRAAEAILKII